MFMKRVEDLDVDREDSGEVNTSSKNASIDHPAINKRLE